MTGSISLFARRLAVSKTSTSSSLLASTATRALSSQAHLQSSQSATSSDRYLFALAAAAATAGWTTTHCEREGCVRDPKTPYGINAENVIKIELRKHLSEQKERTPPPPAIHSLLEEEEEEVNEPPVVTIEEPTPVALSPTPLADSPDAEGSTTMTPEEARLEAATLKAKKHGGGLKLFSGNGNMGLSLEIAKLLGVNLGRATVSRFADGEINVAIHENVRGKDVYIIQPTCPPVNNNLMELLLMVSCLNRASARRVTVVIPYYGYARQDRKMQARVPISAADVARLLESMGVDRVIAVDLHCGQIQGFFGPRVPVDNLEGGIVGIDHFGGKDLHNPVIVSPDAGGVYRAKKFKEGLAYKYGWEDIGIAMIIKQRARAGSVDQMDLVGDVSDSDCIIVDDMIDTAGTLCKAADVLVAKGARRVFAFASHGLLSGPGNERIANSNLEECVILNTIPSTPQRAANEKLVELSVAPLLAQTIFNIHAKRSISALFK
jgi:ribose-phosphate pyrophosphokinase